MTFVVGGLGAGRVAPQPTASAASAVSSPALTRATARWCSTTRRAAGNRGCGRRRELLRRSGRRLRYAATPATRTNTHWFAAGQVTSSQRPSGDQLHLPQADAGEHLTRHGGARRGSRATTSLPLPPSTSASVRPSGDNVAVDGRRRPRASRYSRSGRRRPCRSRIAAADTREQAPTVGRPDSSRVATAPGADHTIRPVSPSRTTSRRPLVRRTPAGTACPGRHAGATCATPAARSRSPVPSPATTRRSSTRQVRDAITGGRIPAGVADRWAREHPLSRPVRVDAPRADCPIATATNRPCGDQLACAHGPSRRVAPSRPRSTFRPRPETSSRPGAGSENSAGAACSTPESSGDQPAHRRAGRREHERRADHSGAGAAARRQPSAPAARCRPARAPGMRSGRRPRRAPRRRSRRARGTRADSARPALTLLHLPQPCLERVETPPQP